MSLPKNLRMVAWVVTLAFILVFAAGCEQEPEPVLSEGAPSRTEAAQELLVQGSKRLVAVSLAQQVAELGENPTAPEVLGLYFNLTHMLIVTGAIVPIAIHGWDWIDPGLEEIYALHNYLILLRVVAYLTIAMLLGLLIMGLGYFRIRVWPKLKRK